MILLDQNHHRLIVLGQSVVLTGAFTMLYAVCGDELGDDHSRVACTFRLPRQPDLIIEHDPAHYMAYFEGGTSKDQLRSGMGGALGRDGCVYAFLGVSATLVK